MGSTVRQSLMAKAKRNCSALILRVLVILLHQLFFKATIRQKIVRDNAQVPSPGDLVDPLSGPPAGVFFGIEIPLAFLFSALIVPDLFVFSSKLPGKLPLSI